MALKRISHKHTEEQVNRGFDILTNGQLPPALSMIKEDRQPYMKKPVQPWQNINSAEPTSSTRSARPASNA